MNPTPQRRMRRAAVFLAVAATAAQLLTSCTLIQDGSGAAPSNPAGTSEASQRPAAAEGPYQVEYVSDGDTIGVSIAGTDTVVRMIGIDTPEVKDPRKPVQCYGQEASQHAHELLDGATVWLEYDPEGDRQDRYGRTLAYVWVNDTTMANQAMITEGFAHEYTYNNGDYKYQAAFKTGQQTAKNSRKGLWNPATCNGNTSGPAK